MTNLTKHFPDWPRDGVRDVKEIVRLSGELDPEMSLEGCPPQRIVAAWDDFSDSFSASWLVVTPDTVRDFMAWLKQERRDG